MNKTETIKEHARHSTDVGSPEVQIALLTDKIGRLTDRSKGHKHDNSMRRGLIRAVNRRRRLLRYLERVDEQKYRDVASRLDLKLH